MHVVSRFEASLLTISRSLTGQVALDESLHLMRREHARPPCLSRAAIELLKDSLAKGMVQRLATLGAADTRHLGERGLVSGRLWQRVPAEARQLDFSPATLEFLMWLTSFDATQAKSPPVNFTPGELTLGDQLLLLLALDVLDETTIAPQLIARTMLGKLSLARLLSPQLFLDHAAPPLDDWTYWFTPQRAWVLELFQDRLAQRWLYIEQTKFATHDRAWLMKVSLHQQTLLSDYLAACEASNRRDLARWLLVVGGKLLLRARSSAWYANLNLRELRLSEREATYRAGLAVLASFERLAAWRDAATGIGYYDEEYAAAQLLKSDWETLRGDEVCAAAADVCRHYTSLQQWESAR